MSERDKWGQAEIALTGVTSSLQLLLTLLAVIIASITKHSYYYSYYHQ